MPPPPSRNFPPIDFKTRFPGLDGIRALAITMVFALHFGGGTHGGPLLRIVNAIRLRGSLGVDLFFVLSGFLITGILYDTQSDSRFFQRFFGRRSIRIFPVFYLVFAILLVLTPIVHYQWRLGHLAFPFYMANFAMAYDGSLQRIPSLRYPGTGAQLIHFWSLCVEEQFYLIWPLAVWLVRDRVRLIWISATLSLLALALRIVFVLKFPPDRYEMWMWHLLPFRMDALLIGAILALILRSPRAAFWQRRCKWLFLGATAAAAGIALWSPSLTSPWFSTLGLTAVAMASAGLIGATLRRDSLAFRLFHLRPLRILGKYSYGFYVYHLIWTGGWTALISYLTVRLHSSVPANAIVDVLNFAVTFAVAKLSYDLFEVRFLRWKARFEYDSEQTTHRHAFTLR
jgi:peptidoglycan/LPS O-acetylase OafA/YrhL